MGNTVVSEITIMGEERAKVKKLFDQAAVPTEFGCAWVVSGFPPLLCDVKHGDGIVVEEDSIIIKGETKNSPPLPLVIELSNQYRVSFEVVGRDLTNLTSQRWIVESGDASLLDCIEDAFEGEGEVVVYMRDGKQVLKLPFGVPVDDDPAFRGEHDKSDDHEIDGKPLSQIPDTYEA